MITGKDSRIRLQNQAVLLPQAPEFSRRVLSDHGLDPDQTAGLHSTLKPTCSWTCAEMISPTELRELYNKYLELVEFETKTLGVKPTEVRHLIGRLGEFYCALEVGGTLAHVANQHGFDVLDPRGRRISVKTTAQATGFVPIGKSTLDRVDDLMVVQFRNGQLSTVYHGPVATAVGVCRYYDYSGKHELDIAKARRLMAEASRAAQA